MLFDTGYSRRFFDATAAFPASLYRWVTPVKFDPRKALVTQLRELGVQTEEIAAIVLSHFHADHVAGVLDFPGVKVLLLARRLGGVACAAAVGGIETGVAGGSRADAG